MIATPNISTLQFWGTMVNKPTVILISGKAGAGKTTLASYMVNHFVSYKVHPKKLAFATPVKNCAIDIYQWDGIKDERGRKLLQDIGRVGRDYNENIWVDQLLEWVLDIFYNKDGLVIIDDWRFPNEYARLIEKNILVYTIKVLRDVEDLPNGLSKDKSETALNDFDVEYDFIVDNNKSLDELDLTAKEITEILLGKEV